MFFTYEQIMEVLPKETLDFMASALPALEYHHKENVINTSFDDKPSSEDSINFFVLVKKLNNLPQYKGFLGKGRFQANKLYVRCDSCGANELHDLFSKYMSLIPSRKDLEYYRGLTPADIVIHNFKKYMDNCSNSVFLRAFPNYENRSDFYNELTRFNAANKLATKKEIENTIYKDLPISVVSYVETASKVRDYLIDNMKKLNISGLSNNDLVPLSLLISLDLYKDNDTVLQKTISGFLKEKGIGNNQITKFLGINISFDDIKAKESNIYAIQDLYMRYIDESLKTNVDKKDLTAPLIAENIFNRDFTESLIVEKILTELKCPVRSVKNMNYQIKNNYDAFKEQSLNEFYFSLSSESRELIEASTKIYSYLMNSLKLNKVNTDYLSCEDDADTLALLIASYYYDTDVAKYFIDHGVTLDKISNLLGIDLSKNSIFSMPLNKKILTDKYKRFIQSGNNENKKPSELTINDVSYNLCNRLFNKSVILEKLFNNLSTSGSIDDDFKEELLNDKKEVEDRKRYELKQRIFKGIPMDTVRYIQQASKLYTILTMDKATNPEYAKNLALLLAATSSDTYVKNILDSMKINESRLLSQLNVSQFVTRVGVNYELIDREFSKYLYEGLNKDKDRSELTLYNVVKNVFNGDFNNTLEMRTFLSDLGVSYEELRNIDQAKYKYDWALAREASIKKNKSVFENYSDKVKEFFEATIKTYDFLKNCNTVDTDIITNEDDRLEVAYLIATLIESEFSDRMKFFNKNDITLDNVLKIIKVNRNKLFDALSSDNDFSSSNILSKYLKNDSEKGNYSILVGDVMNRLFDNSLNNSLALERICSLNGTNYNILKSEVIHQEDYEKSLTIKDRINLLDSEPVDDIDVDDLTSVLHFGNSLTVHSRYIYDELPKIARSDSTEKSLEAVKSVVDRVYVETNLPDKRPLFSRIFRVSKSSDVPKVTIDKEALGELTTKIDENIGVLSEEIMFYDAIRKYMEVYRRKNRSHYLAAWKKEEEINEELEKLDPRKEEEFDKYLRLRSLKQVITNKEERFLTANKIAMQDLIRINDSIANHFIAINSLEMAKNDLLPLIGTELAISRGRMSEKESLELSKGAIDLFKAMLNKNLSETSENLKLIQESKLPKEVVGMLSSDVASFIEDVKTKSLASQRVEKLDIDTNESDVEYLQRRIGEIRSVKGSFDDAVNEAISQKKRLVKIKKKKD